MNTHTARTNALSKIAAALTLTVGASIAQAGIIIDSIHLTMVDSTHSARSGSGTAQSNFASAKNAISNGANTCTESLTALVGIMAENNCGLGRNDNGALYTIKGSTTGSAEFQFGMDWGRGGFVAFEGEDSTSLDWYNSDIWWSKNWSHSDVISLILPQTGAFTLTLLGFEGCCDGINSARYRSIVNANEPMTGTRSQRLPEPQWQDLEVNAVPLPASLPLVALGGLLMLRRRKRTGVSPL